MSRIPDLGEGNVNLSNVLAEYEKAYEGVEAILKIEGKKLEYANRENPVWHHYYDQKRIELYTLTKYMEGQIARVRAKLFRSYVETYARDISERAIDKYVDNEQAYLNLLELSLEVQEIYKKFESACNAFTTRGYALNNITKIRCSSLEDVII